MNIQSFVIQIGGFFALFAISFLAYRYFVKAVAISRYTKVTSSCYRFPDPTNPTSGNIYFKLGLLASTTTLLQNTDIKKITGTIDTGTTTASADAKWNVTKSIDLGITTYFLNVVCDIKKQLVGPDLPLFTKPGTDLTFSIDIEYVTGGTDRIDEIKPIPIDIVPC